MRDDWPAYFLRIAAEVATRSTCPRAQVGAVLVLENRLIAAGYNGAPTGHPHCTDIGCLLDDCPIHGEHCIRAIHAEQNVLEQADWMNVTISGDRYWFEHYVLPDTVLYLTHQPCRRCDQRIREAGITSVIYASPYTGSLPGEGPCTLLAS